MSQCKNESNYISSRDEEKKNCRTFHTVTALMLRNETEDVASQTDSEQKLNQAELRNDIQDSLGLPVPSLSSYL